MKKNKVTYFPPVILDTSMEECCRCGKKVWLRNGCRLPLLCFECRQKIHAEAEAKAKKEAKRHD